MQHRVTVRTHRDQVLHGVDPIGPASRRHGLQMVHVDEVAANAAVALLETEAAHLAATAMPAKAGLSCSRIALVCIDKDPSDGTLTIGAAIGHRLWEEILHRHASPPCIIGDGIQATTGLREFLLGKERSEAPVEDEGFDRQVGAAGIHKRLKTHLDSRPFRGTQHAFRGDKASIPEYGATKVVAPVTCLTAGTLIGLEHRVLKFGFE